MISKHGHPLLAEPARLAMMKLLFPNAFLVTPNLHEAGVLAEMTVYDRASMMEAAARIAAMGPEGVLVKGGHLKGEAVDLLHWKGSNRFYPAPRIDTPHTHGTGCTYSACITAELAKGRNLPDAVDIAKKFITRAIENQSRLRQGRRSN